MHHANRGSLIAGVGLILLGALFICLNLIPGVALRNIWPVIFLVIAFAFFLPGLVWLDSRKSLAALFIPGTIFFVLGAIFLFCTLTGNWIIWAFAWLLIPASVGLGMMLAAWAGGWSHGSWLVGVWMALVSVVLFAVFAALFGNMVVKFIGAGLLVLLGLYMLFRSYLKKPKA